MSAFNRQDVPSSPDEGKNNGSSSAFMNRLKQQYSNSPGFISSNHTRALPGQVRRTFDEDLQVKNNSSNKKKNNSSLQLEQTKKALPGSINSSNRSIEIPSTTTPSVAMPSSETVSIENHNDKNSSSINTIDMYFTNGVSNYRISQFQQLLNNENIDLNQLRKLAWNGIPSQFRPDVWHILLGYLPTNRERRLTAITRKRNEYLESIPIYLSNTNEADRTTQDGENLRQIQVDLPRTSPDIAFFQQPLIQSAMERILYLWAIRHPASGYVQGMNDLLTPLLLISLQRYTENPLRCDVATLPSSILSNVEADAYWCLTKLLDNIQDHYTFSQPGLQRMMLRLEDLINRIDNKLYERLQNENVSFQIFSFRWMNCFLLRELPLKSIIRLWDTYFSEEDGGFENFHVYICTVLLKTFREKILLCDGFHEIIMFLQNLPTSDWDEIQVEPILSQAYILSTLFDSSPSHLS